MRPVIVFCAATLVLAAIFMGCTTDNPAPDASAPDTPEGVTPDEIGDPSVGPEASAVDAESAEDVIVIDVRSKSEWDTGHVDRAVHIPHTEIADRISEVTTDKDAQIVVYCAVGGRAGRAKAALEELGYTNVENAGGYDDVKDRF